MIQQKGFSLVEALVAVLVLSIGLVGVAGMQLKALQSATLGYQHSLVTLAAIDAQERVWDAFARINVSSETCADLAIGIIESEWIAHWRTDAGGNPLRGVNWDSSGLAPVTSAPAAPGACSFRVAVALGEGPGGIESDAGLYAYTFMLPPTLNP